MLKFISSHRKCSIKKGVLKNFTVFTGKHLCWSLQFYLKKNPAQVFSCKYSEFFIKHLIWWTFANVYFWKLWVVIPVLILQEHSGFNVSLKLWLNLCTSTWPRPSRSLVNNFIVTQLLETYLNYIISRVLHLSIFTFQNKLFFAKFNFISKEKNNFRIIYPLYELQNLF